MEGTPHALELLPENRAVTNRPSVCVSGHIIPTISKEVIPGWVRRKSMNKDILFRKKFLKLLVKRRTEEYRGAVELVEKSLSFAAVICHLKLCFARIRLREMLKHLQGFDVLAGHIQRNPYGLIGSFLHLRQGVNRVGSYHAMVFVATNSSADQYR